MYFTVFLPNLFVLQGIFFFFSWTSRCFFYFLKKKLLGSTTTPSGDTGKYNTSCTSRCFVLHDVFSLVHGFLDQHARANGRPLVFQLRAAHAPLTPRTTHTHISTQKPHTETPQQPIDEPQQQLTRHNTSTTDTQHSTPSDRDESMTKENTTALRDLRTTPKPQMRKIQRRNWLRHKLGGR